MKSTQNLTRRRAVLLMIAVTLMWSIAGAVTKQLETARSFEITFWRSFFTVIALSIILRLWRGAGVFAKFDYKLPSFWVSSVCWATMFTAFVAALTLTTVGNVLVMMAVGPLITALVARVFIGHKLPLRTWGAILVATFGIGYMFYQQMDLSQSGGVSAHALGMLVAFIVPMAAAIHWTVVQRAHAINQLRDFVPCILLGALISAAIALPLAWPFAATGRDVAWLGLLGTVQLAIPCTLAVVCSRALKAPEVSLLALLEVIFGIAWAWIFANEAPTQAVLIGGTLVIAALAANECLGWKDSA